LEAAASQLAGNEHVSGIEDRINEAVTVNFKEPMIAFGAVVSFDIARKVAFTVDAIHALGESLKIGSMFAIIG
jgi:hypothetical protein